MEKLEFVPSLSSTIVSISRDAGKEKPTVNNQPHSLNELIKEIRASGIAHLFDGRPTSQSIPADYWRWKSEGEGPGMRTGLGLCTGFSSTFGALFINVSNLLFSRIGGNPEELSLRL